MLDSKLTPEDLLSRELALPSAPLIFQRLNGLILDAASTCEDFAGLVEQDPALTARVLRVVNSPFFGLKQKISSTARAITLLGLRELRDLVVATTVIDRFRGFENTLLSMDQFWRHSLRCAVICKALMPDNGVGEAGESIFVAGLLHDIGHLLLYRQLPEPMRRAVLEHEASGQPLWQIERESLGFDFAAVGGALLKGWSMPDGLVIPVIHHVDPEQASDYQRETAILHIASRVAALHQLSPDHLDGLIPASAPVWRMAGISPANLAELMLLIKQRLDGTQAFMA